VKFICIGPLCFGIGQDIPSAVLKAKKSKPSRVPTMRMPYLVFETNDDAFVLPNGNIATDYPMRLVRSVAFMGPQRIVKEPLSEMQGVRIAEAAAAQSNRG
jgi:hypothetical protein